MNPEIPRLLLILKKACQRFDYEWRLADDYAHNLVEVRGKKKSFFAGNGKIGVYPLNSNFSAQLASDKAWCYKILKRAGFKIPEGDSFFLQDEYRQLRGDGKELKDAFTCAKALGYPIFVKPNSGLSGILAEVIYSEAELKNHLTAISKNSPIALIQEKIDLPEYRIFVLDGRVRFAYQKILPQILGDGQ